MCVCECLHMYMSAGENGCRSVCECLGLCVCVCLCVPSALPQGRQEAYLSHTTEFVCVCVCVCVCVFVTVCVCVCKRANVSNGEMNMNCLYCVCV